MDRTRLLALALLCVASANLPSQTQPAARERVLPSGFAPVRLARIDAFLQQYVDSGQIGGAVALGLKDGRVVYQRAVGCLAKESGRRLPVARLVRTASPTTAPPAGANPSAVGE